MELDVDKYLYNLVVFKIPDTVNKVSNKNTIQLFLCKMDLSSPVVIGQPEICWLHLFRHALEKTLMNYKLKRRSVFMGVMFQLFGNHLLSNVSCVWKWFIKLSLNCDSADFMALFWFHNRVQIFMFVLFEFLTFTAGLESCVDIFGIVSFISKL